MDNALGQVLAIFTGLLTVAIVALIVSKNAQTGNIIQTFTSGFATDLGAATAPVTGASGGLGSVNLPSLQNSGI